MKCSHASYLKFRNMRFYLSGQKASYSFCLNWRSSTGVPLGIISRRHRVPPGKIYVLCSRLDKCLLELKTQFPDEPKITELASFKPIRDVLQVLFYFLAEYMPVFCCLYKQKPHGFAVNIFKKYLQITLYFIWVFYGMFNHLSGIGDASYSHSCFFCLAFEHYWTTPHSGVSVCQGMRSWVHTSAWSWSGDELLHQTRWRLGNKHLHSERHLWADNTSESRRVHGWDRCRLWSRRCMCQTRHRKWGKRNGRDVTSSRWQHRSCSATRWDALVKQAKTPLSYAQTMLATEANATWYWWRYVKRTCMF